MKWSGFFSSTRTFWFEMGQKGPLSEVERSLPFIFRPKFLRTLSKWEPSFVSLVVKEGKTNARTNPYQKTKLSKLIPVW